MVPVRPEAVCLTKYRGRLVCEARFPIDVGWKGVAPPRVSTKTLARAGAMSLHGFGGAAAATFLRVKIYIPTPPVRNGNPPF
jgi:hypothetical protein